MTIDYKNAGAWGAGSGSGVGGVLTSLQVDNNFYDVDTRLAVVEAALVSGMTFADPPITVGIGSITFHFTDGGSETTDVVVPLPIAHYQARGTWQPATEYTFLDIVTVAGVGAYLVLEDHTSEATFDAEAGDSDPYYLLLFPMPEDPEASEAVDVAGATRTLELEDAGRYLRFTNTSGCTITVPTNAAVAFPVNTELKLRQADVGRVLITGSGGVTINPQRTGAAATTYPGQVLTLKKIASNEWDVYGADGPSTLVGTVATDTYTLLLTDQDKYLRFTHVSGCSITVPTNASAAFETGSEIHLRQSSAGPLTIIEASGVTVNTRTGRLLETEALGAVATLKKVDTNEWDLFGDLVESVASI